MKKFFMLFSVGLIVGSAYSQTLLFRATFDEKLTDEVASYPLVPGAERTIGAVTYPATVVTYVDGKYGKAISLNGTSDLYDLNSGVTAGLINPVNTAMTVAAWIYSTITDEQRDAIITAAGVGGSGFAEQQIIHFNGADKARVVLHAIFNETTSNIATWAAKGVSTQSSATTSIERNKWEHVAIVTNPTTQTVTYYVNGVQAGDVLSVGAFSTTVGAGNGSYRIGAHKTGDRSFFFGYLDEVCMFNGVLTESQIQGVMNNNSPLTSVKQVLLDNEIRVFPNPAKEVLQLEGVDNVKQFTLMTLDGRSILTNARTNAISLSGVPSGNYLLKVEAIDGAQAYKKVIVIK